MPDYKATLINQYIGRKYGIPNSFLSNFNTANINNLRKIAEKKILILLA